MASIDETLEELNRLLPLMADQQTRPEAARPFTAAFYTLYLGKLSGLATAQAENLDRFLAGSAHILEPALPFLDYHLSDRIGARLASGAQAEDWPIISQLRSTLEALKELYSPHLPMAELIPDDEDLDASLREKHATGAVSRPTGLPDGHWWWSAA
ncbi:MAG: hypothetical protein ACJASV_002332 [Pseudorhodobacter sp.]|jgi:hypothetical protein